MDFCLWILVFILNPSAIKLVAIHYDDRTSRTNYTRVENKLLLADSSIFGIKMDKIELPINFLKKDDYNLSASNEHEKTNYNVKTNKISQTTNNFHQRLEHENDHFKKSSHNKKYNAPDSKFFKQMDETPAIKLNKNKNRSKSIKKTGAVKIPILMRYFEGTEKHVQIVYRENVEDQRSNKSPNNETTTDDLSVVPKESRKLSLPHPKDDITIANALAAKVRVLCLVVTHPGNHDTKPRAIKATWGRKCTKLVFVSSVDDASVPTVKVVEQEGKQYLWGKIKSGLEYVYDNHRDDADWFLRADDDTYMIMENLRYLLSSFDHRKPIYFGCRLRLSKPALQDYMSGGAGVVLSREALNRIVNQCLRGHFECGRGVLGPDDVNIATNLHRVGVEAIDSRDPTQRSRFWPFSPSYQINLNSDPSVSFWQMSYYPVMYGIDCCSDYSVSFHGISPEDMYAFEYLIYRLRPYGIRHGMA